MGYSKKQLQPLFQKYQIDPLTNKLFQTIVEMFDEQPNYQLWAVKEIFSKALKFDDLVTIHDWAKNNQSEIKLLEKQNIVQYKSSADFQKLLREIEGLGYLRVIKSTISTFNSDQRKILFSNIIGDGSITPYNAYCSSAIRTWATKFKGYNKMPLSKREKFITTVSSMRTFDELKVAIERCLDASYEWNKEDMLAYAENNCANGYDVVFNKGNQVILNIRNFATSSKLCGQGRTCWCITKNDSYFRDYVLRDKRAQYFYFDFSRKESDCFAHIGFTVELGQGVIYAQTCNNKDMRSGYVQGSEKLSIYDIFKKIGVDVSYFMKLNRKPSYKWALEAVLDICVTHSDCYSIAYNKENILIVNVKKPSNVTNLIGHTFIRNLDNSSSTKSYLMFDFSKNYDNSKAIVALTYSKDPYGSLSPSRIIDVFNTDITREKYVESLGIKESDYFSNNEIEPSVLLHKYIDQDNEKAALELLEKEGANIDINYVFQSRVPVYSAIAHNMSKVFAKIVNTKGFNSSVKDGFGETILGSLLYLYASGELEITKEEEKELEDLMKPLIASKYINLNDQNINEDTVINIACEYPKAVWVVKLLASNSNVNVNVVNDINYTCLGNALRKGNLEALKIIGQRPDLKVRDIDRKEAKKQGIDLNDYIKPNKDIFGKYVVEESYTKTSKEADAMSMALA